MGYPLSPVITPTTKPSFIRVFDMNSSPNEKAHSFAHKKQGLDDLQHVAEESLLGVRSQWSHHTSTESHLDAQTSPQLSSQVFELSNPWEPPHKSRIIERTSTPVQYSDTSRKHLDTLHPLGLQRTFSGLEEGRALPISESNLDSSSTTIGLDPRLSRHQSSKQAVYPSDLQRPSFFAPIQRLRMGRRASSVTSESYIDRVDGKVDKGSSITRRLSLLQRPRQSSLITRHVEDIDKRRKFVLKLAKALLSFGAPSHRIESQLAAASEILDAQAAFVHIPNIIIVTLGNGETRTMRTHFVRASGRIALTSLHKVHLIYRDVLHDKMGAEAGTNALREILRAPPIYPLIVRCALAFVCASIICVLAFGGSMVDMWISGVCACALQYLGLNAASKSSMYANVYEISVSIIVSFVARGLSTIPGNIFCYSAISSAGVVLILPGFTVCASWTGALELTSRNILCGSVRIVYAIIYTLFLGFGLTIGSDFYLVLDPHARRAYYQNPIPKNLTYSHGQFVTANSSLSEFPVSGTMGIGNAITYEMQHVVKSCFRDPSWPWYRQPLPWWTLFFLVPIYSVCSSLSNLQSYRSWQLPVMVAFSCCAYAANRAASVVLPGRTDIVSAAGAFVIGSLGNVYSRVVRGTAFTSMVTGVLFLVPSGIAQGGGLTQTYHSSAEQYSSGFSLALRMIQVACGVTIGLFVSQVLVYALGRRKNAAHFAF